MRDTEEFVVRIRRTPVEEATNYSTEMLIKSILEKGSFMQVEDVSPLKKTKKK